MNLYLSFRSELLKIYRSSTWLLTMVMAAIVPVLLMLIFESDSADDLKKMAHDPWGTFFRQVHGLISFIFLPLFILLICTLLPQIENRNNTWKQVFTSPQSLGRIFISKFLLVQFLVIVFLTIFLGLTLVAAAVVDFMNPAFKLFEHSIDWRAHLMPFFKIYGSVLGMSGFLFWLGLRFKNFIVTIAIGISLWFGAALLLFEYHWEHINKFPFAYPIMVAFPQKEAVQPELVWYSAGYLILFLVLAFIDFTQRKERG